MIPKHPMKDLTIKGKIGFATESVEAKLLSQYHFESIVGHHPKIVEILQLVAQVADTDATVLIQGESGTGKELIARALHENSRRRNKPFVPINCAAIPEHLLESELFGHVRGAFTDATKDGVGWFERADGGTIFLDEVNDMSPALQIGLLRILQTGEYARIGSTKLRYCDVRVIAATSRDLRTLVKEGTFREEVFYRLNIIDIWLPPLRDRKCDIPLLAQHFLNTYGTHYGKPHVRLSEEAETLLLAYDFPGNVRELENMMQRAVILADDSVIAPCHLPADVFRRNTVIESKTHYSTFQAAKERAVERFEREYIVDCLRTTQGNISRAAKSAGIHVTNLHAKMKKYRITAYSFKV
jgi:transcriptional regulator with PAS, ATPase and Fis domain